jgi:hypothetical protein
VNELAVIPCGVPSAARTVVMVIFVAIFAHAKRKVLPSIGVGLPAALDNLLTLIIS